MEEKKELKFDVEQLFNYKRLHEYDEDGQKGFLGYLIREEQWKIENDSIVFPNIVNEEQIESLLNKFNDSILRANLVVKQGVINQIYLYGAEEFRKQLDKQIEEIDNKYKKSKNKEDRTI